MTEPTKNKARFRLKADAHQWIIERGYHSKKAEEKGEDAVRWTPDSYHVSLERCLVYLLDRLVAEGYEPTGLEALEDRIEKAQTALAEWGKALETNVRAELEAI